jgi:hypothetical protein
MTIVNTVDHVVNSSPMIYAGVSTDGRFLLQHDSDGQFFLYNLKTGKRVLSGMAVDNEVVVFDDQGHYDATAEGARYVYWLFPGLGQQFAFGQFESRMHRPDIIRAILRGEDPPSEPVSLSSPPIADLELLTSAPDVRGQVRVRVTAQSQTELKSVRFFVDGTPQREVSVTGRSATAEADAPIPQGVHWVTAVAYDSSGFSSVPKSIRVDGAASPLPKGQVFFVGAAVDDYPGLSNGSLRYAKRDVQLLAYTLKACSPGQYRDSQISVLSDAAATKETILAELRRVASAAGPEDAVIGGRPARAGNFCS